MEPQHEQLPTSPSPVSGGPERFTPGSSPEVQGAVPPVRAPEQAPRFEAREQLTGQGAGNAGAPSMPLPIVPLPAAVPTRQSIAKKDDPISDNPLVADDVDVIEKEWVDRAKKIIKETKDDPYQQGHEVSRLQADYLEKRFGVQVKLPQGQ